MSYIVTTRRLVANAKRRPALGALDPSYEVPGTGHTVAELRASGWTDAQLQQLMSESPELAIQLYNQALQQQPTKRPTGSVSDWLNAEGIKGIKNGYVALSAGLLLILAIAGGGRRR